MCNLVNQCRAIELMNPHRSLRTEHKIPLVAADAAYQEIGISVRISLIRFEKFLFLCEESAMVSLNIL